VLTTAVIGAGPAGLLFSLLGKIAMGDGWTVHLYDKRETYARTHRLRIAADPCIAVGRDLRDPRFDAFLAFLREHGFAPEINVLESRLTELLADMGVVKTIREIRTLEDVDADTVVGADSVRSTVRELVRGSVRPRAYTHARVARLRVVGPDLPARLGLADQFRLSKVLGSLVDYRLNSNGFAEVDLFVTVREHALVAALGASPKTPIAVTPAMLRDLKDPLLRAVVEELERGGREVLLYSTFQLEQTVMPQVSFVAGGKPVFLVGDAAVSLPFFRGMACLVSCAHALARAHAARAFEQYERDVSAIVRREMAIVRARAQVLRGLREIVRLSSMLPFPIQSWWLSAAREPVPDVLSPSGWFNAAIATSAATLASLALVSPWLALLALPTQLGGGFVYRWTLALEPGPHRHVRRIWEVQMAVVLALSLVLVAIGRASLVAPAAWWLLGAAFAAGIYAYEIVVARRVARSTVDCDGPR
jgi:2-polyprenyl-6-methoxyphenol hydroxylase-like FAD-dependent oxidoreductase